MSGDRVLPEGWRLVKFGDVVRKVNDKVDPETAGIDRYIAGEHMDTDDLRIRRWGNVGEGYLGPAFHMRFRPGQVLYGSRRTYLRKVALADFEGICANTTFVVESATPDLLPEFLPYVMTAEAFHEHSIQQSKGSVNPYINFSDLTWYEFALPSVYEQMRIVEVLDESARALAELVTAGGAAELLWLALAHETLVGGATCRLADRVDVLLGRQRHPKYAEGDFMTPYIRAANVKSGYLDLESIYEMNFDPDERATYGLNVGDVLVSEGCGNVDEVGANAVWEAQIDDPVCFQKALIRLRSGPGTTPGLLRHWARFAFESGLFKTIARGTSIWHVSAERTRELPYPDLTIEEQQTAEFVLTQAEAVVNLVSRHRHDAERSMSDLREHLLLAGGA